MKKRWILYHIFFISLIIYSCSSSSYDSLKGVERHYSKQKGCLELYENDSTIQIILIRHGEPDLKKNGWVNRKGADTFKNRYDQVGVKPFVFPFCEEINLGDTIHHSSLERARNTAFRLFGDRNVYLKESVDFIEFRRKVPLLPNVPLPLKFWNATSRVLWLMGFNDKGIENFKKAKVRSKKNAKYLSEYAKKNGKAILVAHGLHNKFVLKYLKDEGWAQVRKGGKGYLSIQILGKKK